MSRKKQREHRRQQQLIQEQNRQDRLESTLAVVSHTERVVEFSGLPFDSLTDDPQLYLEVPHTIERHITIKRVAV